MLVGWVMQEANEDADRGKKPDPYASIPPDLESLG